MFCGYCGQALGAAPAATVEYRPDQAATLPPPPTAEAVTLPPPAPRGDGGEVPAAVGGYRLLRPLGGGGMGSVYEAEDISSGRHVALKLVLPEYAQAPEAIERFRLEGRLASTLAHPRCVFVLAADEDAGRPYIVMELMPGKTLDDLVRQRGPLPVEEAVRKVLDVIDGLHEAHRLGLVHRDVKPSNCFLEAGGRVKVGDFGLAKSLLRDTHLTRTGTFLGTPLYTSPEQVKREPVDAQSDVYSVAATLYFLLTGKAPFETGDALATLARIVADDPPPLRTLRPELPAALDKVVLRGLERDRRRRWRSMEEFRRALLPFLPAEPSIGDMGVRFLAWLIDWAVTQLAVGAALAALQLVMHLSPEDVFRQLGTRGVSALQALGLLLYFLYFGIPDSLWGCTPGKWLLRLRVCTPASTRPPGLVRGLARATLFLLLLNVSGLAAVVLDARGLLRGAAPVIILLAQLASYLALIVTMRRRNGYRGPHEFLSGTRVVRLPWPRLRQRRAVRTREYQLDVSHPEGLPERVGPYTVQGALRWSDGDRTLVAEDPRLGRAVWLWLRPAAEPPLNAKRRDISRATRIRWVGCGTEGDWQWDAFLAPNGCPLPTLTADGRRLPWAEFRPVLEDLADELAASCAEDTLPRSLLVDQVWVDAAGRVQLLGTPVTATAVRVAGAGGVEAGTTGEEQRALDFLRQVTCVALEGRTPDAPVGPVRAAVPEHARRRLLNPLFGVRERVTLFERVFLSSLAGGPSEFENREPYKRVEQLQTDLEATRDRPTEVTRWRRLGHLVGGFLLLHIPFLAPGAMFVLSFLALVQAAEKGTLGGLAGIDLAFVAFFPALWVVWAFLFRGGITFHRGGLFLRRTDGRKAARWQCAVRTLLVWGPVAGLLLLALGLARLRPEAPWAYFGLWFVALGLLIGYAVPALYSPSRGPHDRLVGTCLVPE